MSKKSMLLSSVVRLLKLLYKTKNMLVYLDGAT